MTAPRPEAVELATCPFCGEKGEPVLRDDGWVECVECETFGPSGMTRASSIRRWNTRPASRVEAAATKFLHCVEQYHDAIKLRDDLENSHMWSAELRRMYDAMVKLRAALAAEGDHA